MSASQDLLGSRDAKHSRKLLRFVASQRTAGRSQTIVTSALVSQFGVRLIIQFFNQLGFEQGFDGPVQRSRTQPDLLIGALRDLTHDAIAMPVFVGQSEEDVKRGLRKGIELAFWHNRSSMYRITIIDQGGPDVKPSPPRRSY